MYYILCQYNMIYIYTMIYAIMNIDRSRQWCYLPSMQIKLHGVRSTSKVPTRQTKTWQSPLDRL